MSKEHHVGLIVRSPSPGRVRELLADYAARVARDYHASAPPQDRPGHLARGTCFSLSKN